MVVQARLLGLHTDGCLQVRQPLLQRRGCRGGAEMGFGRSALPACAQGGIKIGLERLGRQFDGHQGVGCRQRGLRLVQTLTGTRLCLLESPGLLLMFAVFFACHMMRSFK